MIGSPPTNPAGIVDWLFRDRRTGARVIGQSPNLPVKIFAGAWLARRLTRPFARSTPTATGLARIEAGAIAWWGLDELLRGVNPWRRLLGAAALTSLGCTAWGGRRARHRVQAASSTSP